MKKSFLYLPLLLVAGLATAQDGPASLPDNEKQDYLKNLKVLKETSLTEKTKIIHAGIAALQAVANDPNAAMNLYEKCLKKADFDDAGKKDKDWRDWKTENKENIASDANKKMLTYQIRWALICLQASLEPEDTLDAKKYFPQASQLAIDLAKDSHVLAESTAPFNGSALGGPIGKVYRLDGLQPAGWPDNIMNIPGIIDAMVLKKAREEGDINSLRKGWDLTIAATRKGITDMQEAAKKQARVASREMAGMPGGRPNANDIINRVLQEDVESIISMMEWAKEADCFMGGDELRASMNMMKLVKNSKPEHQEMMIKMMQGMMEHKKSDDSDPNTNRFNRRIPKQAAAAKPTQSTGEAKPTESATASSQPGQPSAPQTAPAAAKPATPNVEEVSE